MEIEGTETTKVLVKDDLNGFGIEDFTGDFFGSFEHENKLAHVAARSANNALFTAAVDALFGHFGF